MKKKILILGATGFIGRNMAKRFSQKKNYEVHATYNKRPSYEQEGLKWKNVNLLSEREIEEYIKTLQPQLIIQAAATTSGAKDIVSNPSVHVTDNAVMNSYIFRAAAKNNVAHVIFFSCTVMYPSANLPLKETDYDANTPLNEKYFGVANTKLYLEKMCEFFSQTSKTKFTVIRHSNIYGPYDKFDLERSHFLGATISKAMIEREKIIVWGAGEEKRDLLHVDDLCDFVELAIKNQACNYGLYNCGLGEAKSVSEIVKMVIKCSGKNLKIEHDLSKPTIKTSLCLDCSKARADLNWLPKITLNDGISSTMQWWQRSINPETLRLRENAKG